MRWLKNENSNLGHARHGKTTVAKILAQDLNYVLLDLNEFAKSHKLTLGNDTKRNSVIIDVSALKKEARKWRETWFLKASGALLRC